MTSSSPSAVAVVGALAIPSLGSALNHSAIALAHDLDSHHAQAVLNRNFDQDSGWQGKVLPVFPTSLKGRR
jgi:hypothetical protein